jgi:hypothetical protein
MPVVLNVGGGNKQIGISPHFAGWKQELLDIDPRGHPDLCMDARELGILVAGRYDAIYCSHNLEHYHRHHAAQVVRGIAHVMRPEGFVELHVPDVGDVMRRVVQANLDIDDVLYVSGGMSILVRDVLYGCHKEIEDSGQGLYAHKTGFTPCALTRLMMECGFAYHVVWSSHYNLVGFYFVTGRVKSSQCGAG